jgi:hypothetical protein
MKEREREKGDYCNNDSAIVVDQMSSRKRLGRDI